MMVNDDEFAFDFMRGGGGIGVAGLLVVHWLCNSIPSWQANKFVCGGVEKI